MPRGAGGHSSGVCAYCKECGGYWWHGLRNCHGCNSPTIEAVIEQPGSIVTVLLEDENGQLQRYRVSEGGKQLLWPV